MILTIILKVLGCLYPLIEYFLGKTKTDPKQAGSILEIILNVLLAIIKAIISGTQNTFKKLKIKESV